MTPRLALLLAKPRVPAVILDLFRNGQRGHIVLPKFTRYLWQDAAMTIQSVVGMPVLRSVCPATGVVTTWANVTLQRDSAGLHYLAMNGSTSSGTTTAIDFTGTDKMTVFAGIYKASDAARATVVELTASFANAGSFGIEGPDSAAGANYVAALNGSGIASRAFSSVAAPISSVLTAQFDIAGATAAAEVVLRHNGVASAAAAGGSAGTGNFANAAMYIGRRAATSQAFNGRIYALVACGASSTAGQVADVEREVAKLTGVSL